MDAKQKFPVLVLYDTEEEYVQRMGDYMRGRYFREHREIPWRLRVYTREEDLKKGETGTEITILVVAESAYSEGVMELQAQRKVLLSEEGVLQPEGMERIGKYQAADQVLSEIMNIYAEIGACEGVLPEGPRAAAEQGHGRILGFYSPVHRSAQTSLALTMAVLLAGRGRTLYLNFERYAGLPELLPDGKDKDLSDLLYFLVSEEAKFRLRFQAMVRKIGELDYIPAMRVGENLLTTPARDWLQLLERLRSLGEYDYILLDLSESMLGLFDILRRCDRIVTIVKKDTISGAKLRQYEEVLGLYQYEDVLHKTSRCDLPKIRQVPMEVGLYGRGGLAEAAEGLIREMERA